MCEVNCTNCRVSAFKHGFCPDDFCEKHKALGTEDDFIRTLQRKAGKWKITEAYPHNVYCSECHKRYAQTHWEVREDGTLPRNYCPNCGAKMEEGEQE